MWEFHGFSKTGRFLFYDSWRELTVGSADPEERKKL